MSTFYETKSERLVRSGFRYPVPIPPHNRGQVTKSIANFPGPGPITHGAAWLLERNLIEQRVWIELLDDEITIFFRDETAAIEFKMRWG